MATQKLTIIVEHEEKNVPCGSFLSIVAKTLSLLRAIDRESSSEHTLSAQYDISQISKQSPLHMVLETRPIECEENLVSREIVKPFIDDMNRLEKGKRPKLFTIEMEQRAKSLVGELSNGIKSIRYISDELEAKPTQHLAAYVDESLKQYAPYYEVGSVEGPLKVISVEGKDNVEIQDLRFGVHVRCNVSAIQLEEAKELLRKRVVVRGRIKYSRKKPQMITDVFDIRELLDSKRAPQPEDIGRLDLIGDIDPVDYLRGDYCKRTN